MNELLFFLTLLACFLLMLLAYRLFGEVGIFAWIGFASVFANIEVLKTVTYFGGMDASLGNALFGTVFLATDILSENHGKASARKGALVGMLAIFGFLVVSQLDILARPSVNDFAHESFVTLFTLTPRICLGSICAYAFGNMLDVTMYEKFKNKDGNKLLWVRNNVCTLVSQLLDNFVLYFIGFLGVMSFKECCILSVTAWIMEVFVSLADTPFLYVAKYKVAPIVRAKATA